MKSRNSLNSDLIIIFYNTFCLLRFFTYSVTIDGNLYCYIRNKNISKNMAKTNIFILAKKTFLYGGYFLYEKLTQSIDR